MKRLIAFAVSAVAALSLSAGVAGVASATPTATGSVNITPQDSLYKEVAKPVDATFVANITPAPGELKMKPLINSKYSGLGNLKFVPKSSMPVCTALNSTNFDFSEVAARATCPNSIIGDGVATLYLAQFVAAIRTDPVITIFNGGVKEDGSGILLIHAWSDATEHAVLMSGSMVDGSLSVDIPRLTADSSAPAFTLNIPGAIGQDPSYAQASCPTGKFSTGGTFTLGNRAEDGTITDQEVLTTPVVDQACTGLAGSAKFASLKVKGPKSVKSGKKGAFKVTVKNTGTASSKKGKITASGAGKGSATLPVLKPGVSKTITVKAKVKGKKGKKVTVKLKASGGASATGKFKVKVK